MQREEAGSSSSWLVGGSGGWELGWLEKEPVPGALMWGWGWVNWEQRRIQQPWALENGTSAAGKPGTEGDALAGEDPESWGPSSGGHPLSCICLQRSSAALARWLS